MVVTQANTDTKACLEAAGDARDTKAGIYLIYRFSQG